MLTNFEFPGFLSGKNFEGMNGCEISGTVTTGVLVYCIHCKNEIIAEWTSRQKFPRLQELVDVWEDHVRSLSHLEMLSKD